MHPVLCTQTGLFAVSILSQFQLGHSSLADTASGGPLIRPASDAGQEHGRQAVQQLKGAPKAAALDGGGGGGGGDGGDRAGARTAEMLAQTHNLLAGEMDVGAARAFTMAHGPHDNQTPWHQDPQRRDSQRQPAIVARPQDQLEEPVQGGHKQVGWGTTTTAGATVPNGGNMASSTGGGSSSGSGGGYRGSRAVGDGRELAAKTAVATKLQALSRGRATRNSVAAQCRLEAEMVAEIGVTSGTPVHQQLEMERWAAVRVQSQFRGVIARQWAKALKAKVDSRNALRHKRQATGALTSMIVPNRGAAYRSLALRPHKSFADSFLDAAESSNHTEPRSNRRGRRRPPRGPRPAPSLEASRDRSHGGSVRHLHRPAYAPVHAHQTSVNGSSGGDQRVQRAPRPSSAPPTMYRGQRSLTPTGMRGDATVNTTAPKNSSSMMLQSVFATPPSRRKEVKDRLRGAISRIDDGRSPSRSPSPRRSGNASTSPPASPLGGKSGLAGPPCSSPAVMRGMMAERDVLEVPTTLLRIVVISSCDGLHAAPEYEMLEKELFPLLQAYGRSMCIQVQGVILRRTAAGRRPSLADLAVPKENNVQTLVISLCTQNYAAVELPARIDTPIFDRVLHKIDRRTTDGSVVLGECKRRYTHDENSVRSQSVLSSSDGESDTRTALLQAGLASAAGLVIDAPEEFLLPFVANAWEQEVRSATRHRQFRKHCLHVSRIVVGYGDGENSAATQGELGRRLAVMKGWLRRHIPPANHHYYSVSDHNDKGDGEAIKTAGTHTSGTVLTPGFQLYLARLQKDLRQFVQARIQRLSQAKDSNRQSEIEQQVQRQLVECNLRAAGVVGRESLCTKVRAYLQDQSATSPLFMTGSSGSGKSAFVADLVRQLSGEMSTDTVWTPGAVVVRFMQSSPGTSSVSHLLKGLTEQLLVSAPPPQEVTFVA